MTPKSEGEVKEAEDNLIDKAAIFATEYYPERFDDHIDTVEYFSNYMDDIIRRVTDGEDLKEIIMSIIEGKW